MAFFHSRNDRVITWVNVSTVLPETKSNTLEPDFTYHALGYRIWFYSCPRFDFSKVTETVYFWTQPTCCENQMVVTKRKIWTHFTIIKKIYFSTITNTESIPHAISSGIARLSNRVLLTSLIDFLFLSFVLVFNTPGKI